MKFRARLAKGTEPTGSLAPGACFSPSPGPRLVLGVALALGFSISACGSFRTMTAANGDLSDYRAFRVAEREGVRLGRAQKYIEAHPRGEWFPEVRAAFDREEPPYFAECSHSREGATAYLTHLPRGPHADVAAEVIAAEVRKGNEESQRTGPK